MDDKSEAYKAGEKVLIGPRKKWVGTLVTFYVTFTLSGFVASPFLVIASYFQTESTKWIYETLLETMTWLFAGTTVLSFAFLVFCFYEVLTGSRIDANENFFGDVSSFEVAEETTSNPDSFLLPHLVVANLLTLTATVTIWKYTPSGWSTALQFLFSTLYGLLGIVAFVHVPTKKDKPISAVRVKVFFLGLLFLLGLFFYYRRETLKLLGIF